jgi:2,3-bisphosphoglycerate-independent phosphoglycerate mutase
MVWHGGKTALGKLTPPHDITGQVIGKHLSYSDEAKPLIDMMERSIALLENHPVNIARKEKGQNPANAIWLWGYGKRPQLQNFEEKFGVRGAMVSAVDLLKGIARLAEMQVCEVPGATGYLDTDFEGKMTAAVNALMNGCDLAYIHVEAADECGHRGEVQNKVRSIEEIDRRVLAPLLERMKTVDDFSLLILPDHPTPLCIRTHTSDPVPYLLYRSNAHQKGSAVTFTEKNAIATGISMPRGSAMMDKLLKK